MGFKAFGGDAFELWALYYDTNGGGFLSLFDVLIHVISG